MALLVLAGFLVLAAGCRNAPATAREDVRREVENATPENSESVRAGLRAKLLGDGKTQPDVDPHMRASAAQGLGDLGDAEDWSAPMAGLAGPLADDNTQVRMECAISLGKLKYSGAKDERRVEVVNRLCDRAAIERDEGGRLLEREYAVRLAMVNSLVQIGGRSSAAALHKAARRLASDLDDDNAARTEVADKGLLDRCIEGLLQLTGVSRADAAAQRALSDEWDPHLSWWATQISRMPEG
jgi:hypothetical protein